MRLEWGLPVGGYRFPKNHPDGTGWKSERWENHSVQRSGQGIFPGIKSSGNYRRCRRRGTSTQRFYPSSDRSSGNLQPRPGSSRFRTMSRTPEKGLPGNSILCSRCDGTGPELEVARRNSGNRNSGPAADDKSDVFGLNFRPMPLPLFLPRLLLRSNPLL